MERTSTDQEPSSNVYRLAVRFGDEILQAGFTVVPNLLLRYQVALGITASELNFILQVWSHWWDKHDPYPAMGTIAERMGQSRRQVNRYVESLRKKKHLIVRQRRSDQYGQITSEYDFAPLLETLRSLFRHELDQGEGDSRGTNLSEAPLSRMSRGGRTSMSRAPLSGMTTKEYPGEENPLRKKTQNEEDPINSNHLEGGTTHKRELKSHFSKKREVRKFENSEDEDATEQEEDGRDRGDYGPITPSKDGPSSIGQILKARKLAPRSPKKGPTPAEGEQSRPRSRGRRQRPESTPYIEMLIADFSREFHDDHALDSNQGQAARLYRASGLAEQQFVARLYEARSITKDRGNITKPAHGQAGELGLRNRGAYFFKVLRDLLGMKEERGIGEQG